MDFDLTGILAIGGFWLFLILLVLKGPVTRYLDKQKPTESADVKALTERINQLEAIVASMSKDMLELKDTTEFAHKLLTDSSREVSNLNKSLAEVGLLEGKSQESPSQNEPASDRVRLVTTGDGADAPDHAGEILNENTVRFERILPARADKVWQYLSNPIYLSEWLAEASLDARIGGKIKLDFDTAEMPERKEKGHSIEGVVGWCEPERGISYSWLDKQNNIESIVAFELTPMGDKTKLVIKHSRLPRNRMQDFMAGWHTHLDVLVARLSKIAPPEFRKRFLQLLPFYTAMVLAVVAPLASQAAGDNGTYQALSAERNRLLQKYDDLRRDTEEMQKKMDSLKRDDSNEAAKACDQLDDAIKKDYRQMKELEGQIRDFDNALR